ncbi:hypothetical protein DAPPUDRAFT_319532 [Daphnia pulex]|uniref:Uncharacterized protein n=1 Tax=Daphnia pulex TaxID=6669 RepID=E9GM12_DAPPU|nr:hypothetical protein DAPPUDRAFT_319532 [Daphnia pulex]|eukprot:EFX79470.1 hypothetical protein DAPPUDRAFT_319532 [Daphnia pulex]
MATKAGNMGMDGKNDQEVALFHAVVNKNLFQSLSGAIKDVHEHVTLFRNIDGGSIGRVLPKCLSQWTSEKVKAQGVNVLPKANVEGAILEDCKVALTLNDGQKI